MALAASVWWRDSVDGFQGIAFVVATGGFQEIAFVVWGG